MTLSYSAPIRIPFRWLAALLVVGFVVVFAATLTYISLAGLHRLTEERAWATFTELAEQDALQISQLVGNADKVVQDNAKLPAHILLKDNQLNTELLIERLIANLRSNPGLYGAFIGMANGESLRVLAIRKDPAKEAALGAPAGTFWAMQHILATPDGQAKARWIFWSEFREQESYSEAGTIYSAKERPWWKKSREHAGVQVAGPYFFLEAHELGMTLSSALSNGDGVIGMAVSLKSINDTLQESLKEHHGGIVVADSTGKAVAAYASDEYLRPTMDVLAPIAQSANTFYAATAQLTQANSNKLIDTSAGPFVYVRRDINFAQDAQLSVIAFSPMEAYTEPLYVARRQLLGVSLALLIILIPLALWAAHRLTRSLTELTAESAKMQAMDFSDGAVVRSLVTEVDTLGLTQQLMKTAVRERNESLNHALKKLQALAEAGIYLAQERQEAPLFRHVVNYAVQLLDANVGQYWQVDASGVFNLVGSTGFRRQGKVSLNFAEQDPCAQVVASQQALRVSAEQMTQFDLSLQQSLLGHQPTSLLIVPVMMGDKLAGLLVLANTVVYQNGQHDFTAAQQSYASTLAAQTGVALQNMALQESQVSMMDSLIQVMAGAIDAKSAYTGGHCNRVPELAMLLLEAANKQKQGPLAEFKLEGEEELREFRIGAWLHDCGKVTTPEYVVDKATKLEIIYNRIHEVRMRFEVLLRDADIARLNAIAAGTDAATAQQHYEQRLAQLQDDFAFVAQCNIGSEFMPAEYITRLHAIGKQGWMRHFDDRLGLSHAELCQAERAPAKPLPVYEQLLADKPEHVVPRTHADRYDERYGFKIEEPENLYNYGELYNLSVQRGTLSAEERFKINEHIMQTIVMLEQLPLPDSLKRVPEYAGTHHETMKGTGYPRGLSGDQLSVPARIMAVADIFEALTASDRPYKKAKSLSEAIKILSFFEKDGYIDRDIFALLLSSGVYLDYAQRFLDPAQIDEVDIQAYIAALS